MRRLMTAALAAGLVLAPGAAWADHGRGGYGDDCRGGGCGNEREEDYSGGGCKYVCPQDSPITDSFNVCLPGATCYWDGRGDGEGGQSGQDPPRS